MYSQGYDDAFKYNSPLQPDDPDYMEGWDRGCRAVEEEYDNNQPDDDDDEDYYYDEEDEDY